MWLGKSDLTDEHFVRTNDGVEYARMYDDSQSTTGQKRTSSQSPRHHRSRGRRQPMVQQIPEQFQKHMNTRNRMRKRTTTMVRMRNHPTSQTTRIMTWRETLPEPGTTATSELEPRREAHRNTRECVREKTADDEVTKGDRSHLSHLLKIGVKRRLLKKTDMRNDEVSHEC